MSFGEILLEIIKYLGPAALVLIGMNLVLVENRKRAGDKEKWELRQKTLSEFLPLRLQAYERTILFLERISPENLAVRVDGRGKSAKAFQTQMVMEVRAEYEHNLAQQLYISTDSWGELVRAKEQIVSLINQCGNNLPPNAVGTDLGKLMISQLMKAEISPSHAAIRELKSDIQGMFRY